MSIDPQNFEYSESRWGDLFRHLKSKGFDVYSPETKVGACVEPYIVIRYGAGAQYFQYSSERDTYELLVYMPQKRYSEIEPFVQRVKAAMKELHPLFVYDKTRLSSYYDEELKAHMVELDYYNVKKL